MLNRAVFYDAVRHGPCRGIVASNMTVRGTEGLLDEWEKAVAEGRADGLQHDWCLADILAQIGRETGWRMFPVREGSWHLAGDNAANWTDAQARAFVKKQGYPYAAEINGHVYYGRGRIQNTWLRNMTTLSDRFDVDFVNDPDLILSDWDLDARVTVAGFLEGLWSVDTRPGLKPPKPRARLALYFPDDKEPDQFNSRRIVNGVDHASEIAVNRRILREAIVKAEDA